MPHFTGKERDNESGLDYFGARYYVNSMGRWMSSDWAAKAQLVPYAKLDNPQWGNISAYSKCYNPGDVLLNLAAVRTGGSKTTIPLGREYVIRI
jgi:RHS repeat-associated protein